MKFETSKNIFLITIINKFPFGAFEIEAFNDDLENC